MQSTIGGGPKYALRPKTATIRLYDTPGPGQYSAENPKQPKSPAAVMGKAERKSYLIKENKGANPGPGAYAETRGLDKGKSYTYRWVNNRGRFGGPRSLSVKNGIPGPGAYDI